MLRGSSQVLGPGRDHRHVGQLQQSHQALEKGGLLADRVEQRDAQLGPGNLQRQAGETAAAANVDQAGAWPGFQQVGAAGQTAQGVQKVSPHDLLALDDRRQVHALIPGQ